MSDHGRARDEAESPLETDSQPATDVQPAVGPRPGVRPWMTAVAAVAAIALFVGVLVVATQRDEAGEPVASLPRATLEAPISDSLPPTTLEAPISDPEPPTTLEDLVADVLSSLGLTTDEVPIERITYEEASDDPWAGRIELGPNPADIATVDVWRDPANPAGDVELVALTNTGDTMTVTLNAAGGVLVEASDGSRISATPIGSDIEITVVTPTGDVESTMVPRIEVDGFAPVGPRAVPVSPNGLVSYQDPQVEPFPVDVTTWVRIPITLEPGGQIRAGYRVEGDCYPDYDSLDHDSGTFVVSCGAAPYVFLSNELRVWTKYENFKPKPEREVFRTKADCHVARQALSDQDWWRNLGVGGGSVAISTIAYYLPAVPVVNKIALAVTVVTFAFGQFFALANDLDCGSVKTGSSLREEYANEAAATGIQVKVTAAAESLAFDSRFVEDSASTTFTPFTGAGRYYPKAAGSPPAGLLTFTLVTDTPTTTSTTTIPAPTDLRFDGENTVVDTNALYGAFAVGQSGSSVTVEVKPDGSAYFSLSYGFPVANSDPAFYDYTGLGVNVRFLQGGQTSTDGRYEATGVAVEVNGFSCFGETCAGGYQPAGWPDDQTGTITGQITGDLFSGVLTTPAFTLNFTASLVS